MLVRKIKKMYQDNRSKLSDYWNRVINNTDKLDNELILFLGFDYKYRGNSKYLFDFMIERNEKVVFATNDISIPKEYRVSPESEDFYKLFYKAKIVIAETWIPTNLLKRKNQFWIQLWHGTPLKKMLFDSFLNNGNLKNKLYLKKRNKEIKKWDYLLVDSNAGKDKLSSSFDLKIDSILNLGYPRVEWLKINKDNTEMKRSILEELGVERGKKILLYVPTWRDYETADKRNVFLELDKVGSSLDEYTILVKSHPLMKDIPSFENIIYIDGYSDLQKYLLIADVVISDYSSVIFDVMAVDIPVFLYTKDIKEYSEHVGVYDDILSDLKIYNVETIDELINKIKNIKIPYFYNLSLKKYYTSSFLDNSTLNIYREIKKLMSSND